MADWANVGKFTGSWTLGTSITLNMDFFPPASTAGLVDRNLIVAREQVQCPSSSLVNLLDLVQQVGGNGATGSFNCLRAFINILAPTANPQANYVAFTAFAQSVTPDGGVPGAPRGSLFGANIIATLISTRLTASTDWWAVVGEEVDVAIDANSTAADKIGHQVVQVPMDATLGSRSNLGYSLNNGAASTPGWDVGLCFGAYNGFNPMNSNGTLIGSMQHGVSKGYGVPGSMGVVTYGVDLTGYAFQGAPFLAPLQTPASSSAPGKTGSICWDSGFIYVCTATNTWKRAAIATW